MRKPFQYLIKLPEMDIWKKNETLAVTTQLLLKITM